MMLITSPGDWNVAAFPPKLNLFQVAGMCVQAMTTTAAAPAMGAVELE